MAEITSIAPETLPGRAPDFPANGPAAYIHWGPVIAGAVVAAAALSVLMGFAVALGLAVVSVSPTWRDTSVSLTLLSGAWVVLTAIGSFALGGYIAGRVRSTWPVSAAATEAAANEIHFRDGLHGLIVWGLAVIIGAVLTWGGAATIAQSTTARTASNSATAEPSFLTFELDRLFRSDRRPEAGDAEARAEAARIIQTGLGRRGFATDDRDFLVRLVASRTGLSAADADRRVTQIVSEARDAASKARRSAVVMGFTLAAALLAAAAAAWGAALIGGRHRDQNVAPPLYFHWRRRSNSVHPGLA